MIKATYYTHMGSDDMVVDMARASFDKTFEQFSPERNAGLIRYLARGMSKKDQEAILEEAAGTDDLDVLMNCFNELNAQTHWAPLAHPQITLHMKVPLIVARQDFKHVIGMLRSEESRRYVDRTPDFHAPDLWRSRPESNIKQGSGSIHSRTSSWSSRYNHYLDIAEEIYTDAIEDGIAPEQARMMLPQSMVTSYFTTGSLASWARAFNQRIDSHAQQEIQELYQQVGEIIAPLYPVSWDALTGGGR